MYREIEIDNGYGVITKHIIRDNGNQQYTSFAADESIPEYQAYLKFLDEGGVPLPADEVTE
jgi:hypothetical protein